MTDPSKSHHTELRRAPGRWVEVDHAQGVVTKNFRGSTPWARLRDRWRAAREAELLGSLAAVGVRVPRVLAVERHSSGVWSVRLAEIKGARTAEVVLAESQASGDRTVFLQRAARLLAAVQAAGVDQPDWHAKNVLVAPDGELYAIDFHAARASGPLGLGPRLLERDLVTLTASHRETTTPDERRAFLEAWWDALPPRLRKGLSELGELGPRVEELARIRRREVCAGYAKPSSRAFRISSWFAPVDPRHPSPSWLVRRGSDDELREAAIAGHGDPRLQVTRGTRDEVERAWGRVARLAAHGLAGPRPLILDLRDERACCAWFDFGHPGTPRELALPPTPEQRRALDAALEDRGVALAQDLPRAFCLLGDELCLSPLAELQARDPVKRSARRAKRARRRKRRKRLARAWPIITRPPLLPISRASLSLAARLARFTSIESRLRRHLATGLPGVDPGRLTPHIRRHMARLALEWGRLATDPAWRMRRVTFDPSVKRFDEALAAGQGVIVITPHLGNWELLAAALVARGARGAVVGRRRLRDPSGTVLEDLRRHAGVETLPQDTHPRKLLRRLGRGEVIGLLPDLEVQRLAGVRLPFLGQEALVMTAPAALARAARLPLLPARCVMDESSGAPSGPYQISFGEPIHPPKSRSETAQVTARWVAIFEDWIRAAPSQWLWVHDRWRTPPSAADKVPLAALRHVQAGSKSRPT